LIATAGIQRSTGEIGSLGAFAATSGRGSCGKEQSFRRIGDALVDAFGPGGTLTFYTLDLL
jgi:hypothetical protein